MLAQWGEGKAHSNLGHSKNLLSRDNKFSVRAVAARLGVSAVDVQRGVELLACHARGGVPVRGTDGRTVIAEAGEEARERVAREKGPIT